MDINEYRDWRPTYSLYEKNLTGLDDVNGLQLRQFLALTGLVSEATEAMSVLHKDFRNSRPIRLDKIKDELSDVWWYFNMCLDEFDLTLNELSEYNKNKLDERNK